MSEFITLTYSSGSSFVLSHLYGIGIPRLFDGSSLYVYRLARSLQSSADGVTWNEIGNGATPLAVCQDSSGSTAKTLQFTFSGIGVSGGYYQSVPESTGGWVSTGSTPAGFSAIDAVSDSNVGVLVGNSHSGTESRIVKSALTAPYAFADSDSGIPQSSGSVAIITDLEI